MTQHFTHWLIKIIQCWGCNFYQQAFYRSISTSPNCFLVFSGKCCCRCLVFSSVFVLWERDSLYICKLFNIFCGGNYLEIDIKFAYELLNSTLLFDDVASHLSKLIITSNTLQTMLISNDPESVLNFSKATLKPSSTLIGSLAHAVYHFTSTCT